MKKHISLLVLLLLSSINLRAQTLSNENFIYSATPQKAVQAANYNTLTPSEVKQNITYFDGLGRPAQSIAIGQGGDGSNIVTHIEYDAFGRQVKDYLPYASAYAGNAYLKTIALSETKAFYYTLKYENTNNPFSQKEFEASPLNRVLQQAAPGNDWALIKNQTIKTDYQTNTASEVKSHNVALSFANNTYTPTLSLSTLNSGFYQANQLYKTITKDENWILADGKNKTTEEFKDKEGHVVLKRTYSNYTNTQGTITATEVVHDTYYIYDLYGNLTYVLPPKAEGLTDINTLNNLCYQYVYDYRNRLVEKKLPGKEWEYIVYDKLDRPILTQDANLRTQNKWLFTKYDVYNRPVYTGDYLNTTAGQTTREQIQGLVNASITLSETKQGSNTINGTIVFYTNNAFPNINNTNINLFTINYYDDYNFDKDALILPNTSYGQAVINYDDTNKPLTKGLATGSKIRILGTTNWTTTLTGYDVKGRSIYSISKNNYLATTNTLMSQLDFTGKTLETTSIHLKNTITTKVVDVFSYDHAGRLLSQKQTINNQTQEVIAANTYDDLGQLTIKGVGGKITQNRLQTVDYTYNIRGWLKNINDINAIGSDLFAFQINYNTPTTGTPLYNGNISQTLWKTSSVNITGNPVSNIYSYNYDALNRLTSAIDNTANYNESLSYDKNGNIMGILRKGNTDLNATIFGTMDNLTYTYDNGNKLTKVEDSSGSTQGFNNGTSGSNTDYTYDDNGNMKADLNKAITGITYNHLNLPSQVVINGGTVNYVYDAAGTKQRKIVNGITTDYAGGFIYENNVMKFFSQPEGYVSNNSGTFDYIYQYKDHLGNIRLSYGDANNDGMVNTNEIVEENNYYPFGLKHKGYNGNVVLGKGNAQAQKYKYNGKELQDDDIGGFKLNLYDYGARNYDPALGRWMNIDPLAEEGRRWSPYCYGMDNPVYFIDPDGMLSQSFINDLIGKSDNDKATKWTNNDNGSFSASNGESATAESEASDPPKKKKAVDPQSKEEQAKYHNDIQNLNKSFGGIIKGLLSFITFTAGGEFAAEESIAVKSTVVTEGTYTVAASKFDYFFGRVVTGSASNVARSAQNLKDLSTLGIKNEAQLTTVFNQALENGSVVSTKTTEFGTSVMRSVNVGGRGSVDVSFFYKGGDMSANPSITTIIPRIFK